MINQNNINQITKKPNPNITKLILSEFKKINTRESTFPPPIYFF